MTNLENEIKEKLLDILHILEKHDMDKAGMLSMCIDNTDGSGYVSFFMLDSDTDGAQILGDAEFIYMDMEENDEIG